MKIRLAVELDGSMSTVTVVTWPAIEHGLIKMLLQFVMHGAG